MIDEQVQQPEAAQGGGDGLTPQEFAKKIKAKYPQYKDVDDITLAKKMVEKYPEYKSQVSFESPSPSPKGKPQYRMMTEDELEQDKKENPQNYQGSNRLYVNRGIDPRTTYRSGKAKPAHVQEAEEVANLVGIPQNRHLEAQSEMMSDSKSGQGDFYLKDIDARISASKTSDEVDEDNDELYPEYRDRKFEDLNASKMFKPEELRDIDTNDFRDYLVRSGWANKIDTEEANFGHIEGIREGDDTQSQAYKHKVLTDYLLEKRNTLLRDKAIYDKRVQTGAGDYKQQASSTNARINALNKQIVSQVAKFEALKERQDKLSEKEKKFRDYLRGDDTSLGTELEYYGSKAWNGVTKVILNTVGSTLDMIGDIKAQENKLRGDKERFTFYHNAGQATDDIYDMISVDMPEIQPAVLSAPEVVHNGDTYQVKKGVVYKDGIRVLDDEISNEDYAAIVDKSKTAKGDTTTVSGRALTSGAIDVIGQLYMMVKTAKALPIKNYTAAAGLAGALQVHHDTYTQVKQTLEDAVAQGQLDIPRKDIDGLATMNAYINDMVVASTGMLSPNKPLANLEKDAIIGGIRSLYSKEAGVLGRRKMADFMNTVLKESLKEVVQEETELVLQKQTNALTNMLVNKDVLDTNVSKDELLETGLVTFLGTGLATGKSHARTTFGNLDTYNIKRMLASKDSGDISKAVEGAVREGDITPEFAEKLNKQILQVRQYDNLIPDNVHNEKRERILPLLERKKQLEEESKTKDSAFKEVYKAKIEKVDSQINEIVNEKAVPVNQSSEGETPTEQTKPVEGETIREEEVTPTVQEEENQTQPEEKEFSVEEVDKDSIRGKYETIVNDTRNEFYAAPDRDTALDNLKSRIKDAVKAGKITTNKAASLLKSALSLNQQSDKQVDKFLERFSKAMALAESNVRLDKISKDKKRVRQKVKKVFNVNGEIPNKLERLKTDNVPVEHVEEYATVMDDLANSPSPDMNRAEALWDKLQPAYDQQVEDYIEDRLQGKETNDEEKESEVEIVDDLIDNMDVDHSTLQPYESDIVRKFQNIPKEWITENLNKRELRALAKSLMNLNDGRLLNKTINDVLRKHEVNNAVSDIEGSIQGVLSYANGFTDKLYRILSPKSRKSVMGAEKAFSNTMLQHIDSALAGIKGTPFYKNVIHRVTAGFSKTDVEVEAVYEDFMNKLRLAEKSRKSPQGYYFDLAAKMQWYLREKEFSNEANKDLRHKTLHPASDYAQLLQSNETSKYSDEEKQHILNIYEEFRNPEGGIDLKKMEQSFNSQEKEVLKFMQDELAKGRDRNRYVNDHIKGESLTYMDDYFPRKGEGDSFLDEDDIASRISGMLGSTSVRAGGSNARTTAKVSLDFNTFGNFMQHVRENLMEYNLAESVKTSGAILSKLKKSKTDNMSKVAKAMETSLKKVIKLRLEKGSTKQTKLMEAWNVIVNNTYNRLLGGVKRGLVDATVQGGTVALFHLDRIPEIRRANKKMSREVMNSIMSRYGSTQLDRLAGSNSADKKEGVTTTLAKRKFSKLNPTITDNLIDAFKKNKIGDFGNWWLRGQYRLSDGIISSLMWKADFLKNFKKVAGVDFDESKHNNPEYLSKMDRFIREAVSGADKSTSNLFNTAASVENKITAQEAKGLKKDLLFFMKSFSNNEASVMRDSVMSLFGQGTIESKAEAGRLFATVLTRNMLYAYMQQTLIQYAMLAFGIGGDDDEFEEQAFRRATGSTLLLALLGGRNNAVNLGGAFLLEYAYERMLVDEDEEFDKYKDSAFYTLDFTQPTNKSLGTLGAPGVAGQAIWDGVFKQSEIISKMLNGEELSDAEITKLKTIKAEVSLLSQLTGLPMEDIGKAAQSTHDSE